MTHPAHMPTPTPTANPTPIRPDTLWERLNPDQRRSLHQALITLCRQLAERCVPRLEEGPKTHE